jgi:hypothetical protein
MSLSSEDLSAIGSLMDNKLNQARVEDRRRRRFWLWFWIVLFVVSSVASWFMMQRYITKFQAELAQADARFVEAKLAYQQELARNKEMQEERRQAEAAVSYTSGQDQASYEGGLLRGAISLIGKSQEMNRRMADLDPDDIDGLVAATEDLNGLAQGMLGMVGQMMLRNTDPAHNTIDQNLSLGETGPSNQAAPIQVEAEAPAP